MARKASAIKCAGAGRPSRTRFRMAFASGALNLQKFGGALQFVDAVSVFADTCVAVKFAQFTDAFVKIVFHWFCLSSLL